MNERGVSFSMISFFEKGLIGHTKVKGFDKDGEIYFMIELVDGRVLNTLLVDEYVLGLADIFQAQYDYPDLEYVVTGGSWNGYTQEAKNYGRENALGIFNLQEFFGALNWKEPKDYHQRDKDGNPVYNYKTA